jgi:hypothetical protein
MRVSDEGGVRHRYSSKAAWNADGSLLLLDYKDGSREVRNGRTFAVLQRNVYTGSDFSWSNRSPRRGYSAGADDRPQIRRHRISRNGAFSTVHTSNMASIAGWSEMSLGGGQGSPSLGDDVAVMFKRPNGAWGVAVVDLSRTPVRVVSQRVFGTSSNDLDDLIDNVGISHTGRWVSIAFVADGRGERQGIWLYRRSLTDRSRVQVLRQEEHWDWARKRNGGDVFVYRAGSGDVSVPGVHAYNPKARREKLLVRGVTSNVHISGRNVRRCGWVYIGPSGSGSSPGYGAVFAVNIRRPRRVQYFAQSHHTRDLGYASQVQPSASPNGRFVIFASEWGGSQIYAFVAKR